MSLAYGVFARRGEAPRVGARRGDRVLDLAALAAAGRLGALPERVFARADLNAFMAAGRKAWRECGERLADIDEGGIALAEVELLLPIAVADYVDFFSSLEHARNAGRMFRPDAEPLPPNWRHLPIGYHGRAGTVVVSGTPVTRPSGQAKEPDAAAPVFGPSRRLDFELELGFVIGAPSRLGEPVPAERATEHVFGVVLVNDWSARDIQAWESRPLGPFLGKSFATSVGAWVVPLDALEPYKVPAPPQEPEPLPYLREEPWAYDVELEIELQGQVVSRTSARNLYWSVAQQIAHLTINGASLRTGDLLASGTVSGPEKRSRGSLLELSWNGSDPLELADGSTRTFLLDGDEVVLRGATADGAVALGEVRGRVLPA
ncbi:MAG TPA: fumarylacetoacetase [Solirubrobacteraceae bacterium]|nr:fumarylacetoacetase [Solirubrobacteraceae bacterium]